METRCVKLAAVVLCVMAGVTLGITYVWTGEGDGESWSDRDNWDPGLFCTDPCYPSSTNDDATITKDDTIELINVEIDDLTISNNEAYIGGPTFDGDSVILWCDTVTLIGGVDADTEYQTVGGADIRTK